MLSSNDIEIGIVTNKQDSELFTELEVGVQELVVVTSKGQKKRSFEDIINTGLNNIFGNYLSIIFQASLFASAHVAGGFPNGKIGYAMTFIYAILLGCMRSRTKGLLAPIIIQIIADSTIFIFLYCMY